MSLAVPCKSGPTSLWRVVVGLYSARGMGVHWCLPFTARFVSQTRHVVRGDEVLLEDWLKFVAQNAARSAVVASLESVTKLWARNSSKTNHRISLPLGHAAVVVP